MTSGVCLIHAHQFCIERHFLVIVDGNKRRLFD